MQHSKDIHSDLAIQIAASQQQHRWVLLGVFTSIVLVGGLAFLLLPKSGLPPLPPVSSNETSAQAGNTVDAVDSAREVISSKHGEIQRASDTPFFYGYLLAGAKALIDDKQYGPLASEFIASLNNLGLVKEDTATQLEAAIKKKLEQVDRALNDAFALHNASLIARIADSQFFSDYAGERLDSWEWLTTAAKARYFGAVEQLKIAQANQVASAELASLSTIREITALTAHDERIRTLEVSIKEAKKANVRGEFIQLLAAKQYGAVVKNADANKQAIAQDTLLQDVVKQAATALEDASRVRTIEGAKAEADLDNWVAVPTILDELPGHQRDAETKQLLAKAMAVLRSQQKLSELLSRPERLTDDSVRAYARRQMNDAAALVQFSGKLEGLVEMLTRATDDGEVTAELIINSDNRANILIPGQGYVQPTIRKTIRLPRTIHRLVVRCNGQRDTNHQIDLSDARIGEPTQIRLECAG